MAIRRARKGQLQNTRPFLVGLSLSSLYLLWTLGAKVWVESKLQDHLPSLGKPTLALLTTPSPFNTFLWRAVALVPGGYVETYYSLLASKDATPRFDFYPSENEVLETLDDPSPAQQLRWFTHGFYSVRLVEGRIIMTDLRMGSEPSYVFSFDLGRPGEAQTPKRVGMRPSADGLSEIFKRFTTH